MVSDDDQRNQRILGDVQDLCLLLDIQDYNPSKVVWASLVPRWGPVDIGEPLLQNDRVVIHDNLKDALTDEQTKALIAILPGALEEDRSVCQSNSSHNCCFDVCYSNFELHITSTSTPSARTVL